MCRKRFSKLQTALIVGFPIAVTVIILAVTISQVSTGTGRRRENEEEDDEVEVKEEFVRCTKKDAEQECKDEVCITAADYLKKNMNLGVDPCDDFYEYVCGNSKNDSSFSSNSKEAREKLEKIVAANFSAEVREDFKFIERSKQFYNECLKSEYLENEGFELLWKVLENFELNKLPAFFKKDVKADYHFDWADASGALQSKLNLDIFFSVGVEQLVGSKDYILMIYPARVGQSCLSRHKTVIKRKSHHDLSQNRLIMATVVKNVNKAVDEKLFLKAAKVFVKIFRQLKKLLFDSTTVWNFKETPKCYTVSEYTTIFSSMLNNETGHDYPKFWENYITSLFDQISYYSTPEPPQRGIICTTRSAQRYLIKVFKWIFSISSVDLELYVWFSTILELVYYIPPFDKTYKNFHLRSTYCNKIVIEYLGTSLAFFLYSPAPYSEVTTLLNLTRSSFAKRVNEAKWIDRKTKEKILEVVSRRRDVVGYPEWIFEQHTLDTYYNEYEFSLKTFLQNLVAVVKTDNEEKLKRLRTETHTLYEVPFNIKYDSSYNTLFIHNAFMEAPFFFYGNSSALRVINYGLLVPQIARQIGHHFNRMGGDDSDTYVEFTKKELDTLNVKKNCFIQLYDSYTSYDVKFKDRGKRTLSENLADNAALRHSHKSYKRMVKTDKCGDVIPSTKDYTDDQLFFIAYARGFCEKKPSDLKQYETFYKGSFVPPPKIRVNYALQNYEEFSKAFKCSSRSKMSKKKKCLLW